MRAIILFILSNVRGDDTSALRLIYKFLAVSSTAGDFVLKGEWHDRCFKGFNR
jgi:hypothetical protein